MTGGPLSYSPTIEPVARRPGLVHLVLTLVHFRIYPQTSSERIRLTQSELPSQVLREIWRGVPILARPLRRTFKWRAGFPAVPGSGVEYRGACAFGLRARVRGCLSPLALLKASLCLSPLALLKASLVDTLRLVNCAWLHVPDSRSEERPNWTRPFVRESLCSLSS